MMSSEEQIGSILMQRQKVQQAQKCVKEEIDRAAAKLRAVTNSLYGDPLNLYPVNGDGLLTNNGHSFSADQFTQLTANITLYKENDGEIEVLTARLRVLGYNE